MRLGIATLVGLFLFVLMGCSNPTIVPFEQSMEATLSENDTDAVFVWWNYPRCRQGQSSPRLWMGTVNMYPGIKNANRTSWQWCFDPDDFDLDIEITYKLPKSGNYWIFTNNGRVYNKAQDSWGGRVSTIVTQDRNNRYVTVRVGTGGTTTSLVIGLAPWYFVSRFWIGHF